MSQGKPPSLRTLGVLVVAFAVVTASGLGSYLATMSSGGSKTSSELAGSGVFHLTLLEPMNTGWNSTLAQPKFFVVGSNGLVSSANITVPVNTLVQVTIVSYDTPTPGSTDQMGVVSGTVGGSVYLINGTQASMNSMPGPWGQNVTSVPGAQLAHTFTIQQLGINIPVVGGDTEIAYLYFTKAGTFTWLCEPPCGFGPDGGMGAMSASGWMAGQITVK